MFISACAMTYSNVPEDYKLRDNAGVILLSLTASGECGFAYFVEVRQVDTESSYSLGMQDFGHERDWTKFKDECPSEPNNYYGKLVAIELPAGTYEIYQIEGVSKYKKIGSDTDISVKFTVTPNKVNYLGNFHFHFNKRYFHYNAENLSQRDIPLFLNKYKQFNMRDIIFNLLHMKPVRVLSA